jgi:uncharacterized PurR-regulated membrane protein YhhQ (DUF165 family)
MHPFVTHVVDDVTAMKFTPKSIDIVIAVGFGVAISFYKLRPLLLELAEKEKLQRETRRRSHQID